MPCGWNNNSYNGSEARRFGMGKGMGANWFTPQEKCKEDCKDEGGGPAGKIACEAACDLGIPKPKPEGNSGVNRGSVTPGIRVEPMWVQAFYLSEFGEPEGLPPGKRVVIITQLKGAPKGTFKGVLYGILPNVGIKVRVHDVKIDPKIPGEFNRIALISNVPREDLRKQKHPATVGSGQLCWTAKGWRPC